jgi:xanthine/CO dehydrogenase XdhC/CoxF family maturation factor
MKAEAPRKPLKKARCATDGSVTGRTHDGCLASDVYDRLRKLRGAVPFARTWKHLKADR